MKNNKYKILVLSDLKDSASTTLKSTVSLANMINGDIEFFHVKKPMEIVGQDNQLSAMREINGKHLATEKKIKKLLEPIMAEYGISINYKFAFGNVKTEISKLLEESKPDIIVLGKRKPKMMKLIGDSISHFILKNFDGAVLIASDENPLEPNKTLSLGVLNGVDDTLNIDFNEDLMGHTQKPLKSFKIIKNSNGSDTFVSNNDQNIVEYIFEEGDNAINNLSKYLSMSNTNLLFVNRSENVPSTNATFMDADIQQVMDNLNVSLLVSRGKLKLNQ